MAKLRKLVEATDRLSDGHQFCLVCEGCKAAEELVNAGVPLARLVLTLSEALEKMAKEHPCCDLGARKALADVAELEL